MKPSADKLRNPLHLPHSLGGTLSQPFGAFVGNQFDQRSKQIAIVEPMLADEQQYHVSARFDFHTFPPASPITDRTCGGKALV